MRLRPISAGLLLITIALLLGNLAACVESTKNPQVCQGSNPDKCNGRCVNLQNDEKNCGDCGNVCGSGKVCQKGKCVNENSKKGTSSNNNGINTNNKATCNDNIKNGKETDIDCGGSSCSACSDGKNCSKNSDCSSGLCNNGICQASSEQSVAAQAGSESNNQPANNAKLLKPISSGGLSGVGGVRTGYTCEGLRCDCVGDSDCNDMFTNAGCGDVSSCNTDANGVVRCSCLTFSRTNNTTTTGTKFPGGKTLIPIQPINEQGSSDQSAASGQAGTTLITFDDLNTGGLGTGGPIPVTSQYASKGATFNSPVAIDFSKGNAIPGFTHSGTNAIEQCYAAEFCTAPIEIKFSQGQARVKVWVGYDSTINEKTPVILRAFDSSGNQVAQDSDNLNSYQGPIPIQIPLEVSTINPKNRQLTRSNIVRVTVDFLDNNRYTNGLAVDDVEFERVEGILLENPPTTVKG